MTAAELRHRLQSPDPPLLVHVLPEEIFAASRIPGSRSACVYEMAFLSGIEALAPDQDTEMVVYGAGEGSLDAATAREKLVEAGYRNVAVFPGGIAEWKRLGWPLEGSGYFPEEPQPEGDYRVDVAESVVRWTGRNLFNHHHGTVGLRSGELSIRGGRLTSARFTIDLETIVCEDLADPEWNAMLIRHLRDGDFFDVGKHPTAELLANEAIPIPESTVGTPNYLLKGRFTLRGVTRPLEFPVVVAALSPDRITGQCQFEIDRTDFGSVYGSAKFFRFLSKHVVNDHIHLHVKLHADRA